MKKEELKRLYPSEPWKWHQKWTSNVIKSKSKSTLIAIWVLTVFWNVISAPLIFVLPEELSKGNKLAAIGYLFPLVGLTLIIAALRATIRCYKFGRATLTLSSLPGLIGGKLLGSVRLSAPLRTTSGFDVLLICTRTTTTYNSHRETRTTTTKLLWEARNQIGDSSLGSAYMAEIPIEFTIPYSCEETNDEKNIDWNLQIRAEVPGVDFLVEFDVPVFKTKDSNNAITNTTKQKTEHSSSPSLPPDSKIKLTRHSSRHLEIDVPQAIVRQPGRVLGLIAFSGIWSAVIALMIYKSVPLVIIAFFCFFDLLLFLGIADMLFKRISINAYADKIEVQRSGLFGVRMATYRVEDIEKLDINLSGSSQSGSNYKGYYSVQVHLKGSQRNAKDIATGIGDKNVALWVIGEINKTLSLVSVA